MMNRNELISMMNYALSFVPEENEIYDGMEEVISQLEEEWKDEFEED